MPHKQEEYLAIFAALFSQITELSDVPIYPVANNPASLCIIL